MGCDTASTFSALCKAKPLKLMTKIIRYIEAFSMYCASGRKISYDALPTCNDALKLHISRTNHQAYIWQQRLMAQQEQLDPINHGWMHNDKENCLTLKWMKCKPAPNEVRILIPNFYTQMLFNHEQRLNIVLSFIFELPSIFFTFFFVIDIGIDAVRMQKMM